MTVVDHEQDTTTRQPVHRRGLRALMAATVVSATGDGAFAAAAPLAAAVITHSPAAISAVAAAEMLPWLLVTPFAGALVDRWPSRPVMVIADAARAALLAVMAVLMLTGHATIPALAAVAAGAMIGMTFHDTALQRSTLELAGDDKTELDRWNGRVGTMTTTGRELLGQPAGSGLFALAVWLPFAGDAASFAASSALMSFLPRRPKPDQPEHREGILQQIRSGAVWLFRHRILRSYCLLITLSNVAFMAGIATFVLYAQQRLGVAAAGYGLLLAAGAVGGIIGGFTAGRVIGRLGDHLTLGLAVLAQSAAFATIAFTGSPYVAGAAMALAVYGTALATVVSISSRQRLTPRNRYGSVSAVYRTFGSGASPLGAALGGVFATAFGLRAPLLFAAGLLAAVVVFFAIAIRSAHEDATGSGV